MLEAEKDIKSHLLVLTSEKSNYNFFDKERYQLRTLRQAEQKKLEQLQEQVSQTQMEILKLDDKIEKITSDYGQCLSASRLLQCTIEQLPTRDLFHHEKIQLMETRIKQAFDGLSRPLPTDFSHSEILKGEETLSSMLMAFFPKLQTVEPLYTARTDGWDSADFHKPCDGRPNTLVLYEVGPWIFGGFSPLCWDAAAWSFPKT